MARTLPTLHADTLAALKLLHGVAGQHAVLAGYYAAGDGGGGTFWWDSTSTTTADDGLIVQATGYVEGRWRRVWSGRADVRWWGAVADGATNRHLRLQAALDSTVRHLYVPYVGSNLMFGASCSIASDTWLECHPRAVLKLDPNLSRGCVHLKNTTYFGTRIFTLTVSGVPTGGTYTLSVNDLTTGTVAYNASAATLQTALQALSNVGSGNATVAGSNGGPYTVTFAGRVGVYRFTLATNSLTGGSSPTVTPSRSGGTADHDIKVTGGIWDSSSLPVDYLNCIGASPSRIGTGESGGLGARLSFAGVDRLHVERATFRNSSSLGPSSVQAACCNYVNLYDLHDEELAGDGIHVNGPCRGITIRGLDTRTIDDGIAIQAKDWLYGSPYHGCIEDVIIEDVISQGCGNFIKLTMSGDAPMKNVTIRNCRTHNPTAVVVQIFKDTDAYDASNTFTVGTLENLTIDGLYATNFPYRLFQVDHNVKGMRIKHCPLDGATGSSIPFYAATGVTVDDVEWSGLRTSTTSDLAQVFWINGATVKHLHLTGGRYAGRTTTAYAPLVYLQAGTINRLVVSNMTIDADLGKAFLFASGSTVDDMDLVGCRATQTSSGNPAVIESAGTLTRLRVTGGRYVGGEAFLRTATSGSTEVTLDGAGFDGSSHVIYNQGGTVTARLTGCRFDNLAGGVVVHYPNSATSVVRSSNCELTAASVGLGGAAFKNPATGGSCRWIGYDIAQDLTLLTPTKWDVAQSTTAATGPAMYDGSAWQKWGHS